MQLKRSKHSWNDELTLTPHFSFGAFTFDSPKYCVCNHLASLIKIHCPCKNISQVHINTVPPVL